MEILISKKGEFILKKIIVYVLIVLFLFLILSSCSLQENICDKVSDKVIRFHVIANSDSEEDQALKLRVRDEVLDEIGPKLAVSKSKGESQDIINKNLDNIRAAARDEISKSGKGYDVAVSLGKASFPTKQYSDIVFPAGEYDALRVVIGKGEGKNWWCVMFPPLCFIDITRGITSADTESELKSVLSDEEYDSILVGPSSERDSGAVRKPIESQSGENENTVLNKSERVEIKFKSAEVFESIIEKLRTLFGI